MLPGSCRTRIGVFLISVRFFFIPKRRRENMRLFSTPREAMFYTTAYLQHYDFTDVVYVFTSNILVPCTRNGFLGAVEPSRKFTVVKRTNKQIRELVCINVLQYISFFTISVNIYSARRVYDGGPTKCHLPPPCRDSF